MYKEFYGLTTYPFALTPDPELLYLSKNHANCLRSLLYRLEQGCRLLVLMGRSGTGKTLLTNIFVRSLDEKTYILLLAQYSPGCIDITSYGFQDSRLEITGKSTDELLINLKSFLLTCKKINGKMVIIIDEAQNLPVEIIQDLILFEDSDNIEKKSVQIVLVGHSEFEQVLSSIGFLDVNKYRDTIHILLPMNYHDTKCYVEKRLIASGASFSIFTSRAIKEIFARSQGIPREINLICNTALLLNFGYAKHTIDHITIQQVVKELRLDISENPRRQHTNQARDAMGVPAHGLLSLRDTMWPEFPSSSHDQEGVEQVEKHPSQHRARRPRRLALTAGLTGLSLLGTGFVLQPSLIGGKLREYTVRSRPSSPAVIAQSLSGREQPLLPQSLSGREQPLLPQSLSGRERPKKVQWAQTGISYHLPLGKPLHISLPPLQYALEDFPVNVTLDIAGSTPMWLKFDPEKLTLTGTAPLQELGKTYHLIFRAHTPNGLESLLQFSLTLIEDMRR